VQEWGLHLHSSKCDTPCSSNAASNGGIEWLFDGRATATTSTAISSKTSTAAAGAASKRRTSTKQGAAVVTTATAGDVHSSSHATTCAKSNDTVEDSTSSASESSTHDNDHTSTTATVVEANAADTMTADDTHNEHDSTAAAVAAEPEATPEHSATEHSVQQQCTSADKTDGTMTSDSGDKTAKDSSVVTTASSSNIVTTAAEPSDTKAAVFNSGTLSVATLTGHNLHAAVPSTAVATGDTDGDVEANAAVQLYLTVQLGEQEQSTSDIDVTHPTTDAITATGSTVVWPDSSLTFTVATAAELLQGLTVKLWDGSGSTLAHGTVPVLTLQTLCCSADSNYTATAADNSVVEAVVVMQLPAAKQRHATAAATATAKSSEQLATQMSVTCCLSYTVGAATTASSNSEVVEVEPTVAQDTDMQDMLFDTARTGSNASSAGSDHGTESFENDASEVADSVSKQDNSAMTDTAAIHSQLNDTAAAVSDANRSGSDIEDEDLYMSQMADDDATEQ
jgi:hypothetical protein